MTKTKKNRRNGTGNIVYWIMCIFLTTFTIWRGSIQCNESWNQRIYRMELWNVAVACQCDHPCSCIFFRQDPALVRGPLSIWYLSDTFADFICYVANDVVQIQMNLHCVSLHCCLLS